MQIFRRIWKGLFFGRFRCLLGSTIHCVSCWTLGNIYSASNDAEYLAVPQSQWKSAEKFGPDCMFDLAVESFCLEVWSAEHVFSLPPHNIKMMEWMEWWCTPYLYPCIGLASKNPRGWPLVLGVFVGIFSCKPKLHSRCMHKEQFQAMRYNNKHTNKWCLKI